MKFTIYRKSWRRSGDRHAEINGVKQLGETKLLNDNNMFCCLGMIEIQTGVTPENIINIGCPEDVEFPRTRQTSILACSRGGSVRDTKLTTKAMNINDSSSLAEEEREQQLTQLFAKKGHVLKFVDQLAPKSWRVAD